MHKFLSILCLLFLITGMGWADDPVPAFHYNNQRTGQTGVAGPDAPELLWSFRTSASLFASPVIGADGSIYLASADGRLYALGNNGAVKWAYTAEESIFGTPAIAPDGTILFGDLAGKFYAVDAEGTEKWVYRISGGPERRITTSAVVAPDGQSYIGAWNEQFYAVQSDGNSRWKTDLNGYVSSAPVLDSEGNVYIAVNDSANLTVRKFQPSSSTRVWTFEENIRRSENRIISSAAIDSERGRLYIGACSETGALYAINIETGRRIWKAVLDKGIISSPAIATDGTIYAGCLDGKIYAFSPENGATLWTFDADGYFVLGSPSVDGNGVIYVGDSDGILYALSPAGEELWRWETNNSIESAPVVAPDGTLYFTSTDSTLYALKNPTAVWGWKAQ